MTLFTAEQQPRDGFRLMINAPAKFNGQPGGSVDVFRISVLNIFKLTGLEENKKVPYLMTLLEGAALSYFIANKLHEETDIQIVFDAMDKVFKRRDYYLKCVSDLEQGENETIFNYFGRCQEAFLLIECKDLARQRFLFINGLNCNRLKDKLWVIQWSEGASIYAVMNTVMNINYSKTNDKTSPGSGSGDKMRIKKCHVCKKTGHKAKDHFT